MPTHEEDIASVTWFTVSQLAARWHLAENTVRDIPIEQLRYKEFGNKTLKRRRYKPEWVYAFENHTDHAAA